jgi:hypothetical protein
MSRISLLGALCGGLTAGFLGSIAQDLLFSATKKVAAASARAFESTELTPSSAMASRTRAERLLVQAALGVTVAFTYRALQRTANPTTALLGSWWVTRKVPSVLRPSARRWTRRALRVALPARDAWLALT